MTRQPPKPRKSTARTPRPRDAASRRSGAQAPTTSRTKAASSRSGEARPPRSGSGRPAARKKDARRGSDGRGRRTLKTVGIVAALVLLALLVTGGAVLYSMAHQLPNPDLAQARGRDQSSVIVDRNGKLLTRLYAEENRQDVALSKMPAYLRQAVIATEDKRFYQHEGVDPIGIARALVTDVIKGSRAQGGSTITQQYVKQAFVTSERTIKRKIQEAILAQRIERKYSKDQLLERYLNTIYFGHGAYGVESASRTYFGRSSRDLTLAQAAMIAGVIKSPGRYSPFLDAEAARNRRDTVLSQMLEQEYISEAEYTEATTAEVDVVTLKGRSTLAPYFVEWVKSQLVKKYGERTVYRGGLTVVTTLDIKMQRAAEKAVAAVLDETGDPSASVVALEPGTGAVLAMVGGRDFDTQQFNVAVQGKRQPGSAFKPFVLATALDQGISPEKPFESGPVKLSVGNQVWSVTGASGGKKGPMRLRPATEQSVNSVYAQLILDVGAEKVVETAESMGLSAGISPVPAIALGGLEHGVSPLEMAEAYATLAANGTHAEPYGVMSVTQAKEGTDVRSDLESTKPKTDKALSPAVAYLTTDILTGVIKRGTGKSAAIGRPAAGKTGTTQEYRDAWFVGYTPQIATAVWVGYPDSQREMKDVHGIRVTGGSLPAKIWARFMKEAVKGTEETGFTRPSGLQSVKICTQSGGLAAQFCTSTAAALMIAEHMPESCPIHIAPVKVVVPSFKGMAKTDALAAISRLGLTVSVVERPVAGVSAGIVSTQTPVAGTTVDAGSRVELCVSSGAAENTPPRAVLIVPTEITRGVPAVLDGSTSTDVDGRIVRFYWEFGDSATGTGAKPSHSWAAPGRYQVTLWVTDDRGAQGSLTRTIRVR